MFILGFVIGFLACSLLCIEMLKRKELMVDDVIVDLSEKNQTQDSSELLACGHPKSSLVRQRFGQLPYCELCKRETIS